MKRKLLAILLTLAMVVTMLPAAFVTVTADGVTATTAHPPTWIYATQEATGNGETVDVRVLALVDSINYDVAGVELYQVGDVTPTITKTTTIVYSGVLDGSEILYAPEGTYYLPITFKGISNTGAFRVAMKTFVEKNGEREYSSEYTLWVQNGAVVSSVVRVGSFNIHNGADVGHDFSVLAQDILDYGLDIVGLQEVDINVGRSGNQDTMAKLSEYTGYQYYRFTKAIDLSGGEYGTGILSKYPIESFSVHALPNEGNKEARSFGHAVIDVNGVKINFINTHLDYTSASLIVTQYAAIVQYIADNELDNVLITADFNTNDLALLKTLPGSALAFDTDKGNVEGSFGTGTSQIDNVVYTTADFTFINADVVKEFKHSDHYMIWADLGIN